MSTSLHFVHISDTHIHPDPTFTGNHADYAPIAGARALVEQINALPFSPDFVLHTGDVAYNPEPELYEATREVLGKIKYPVYYIAGNHDDSAKLQSALMGRNADEIVTPLHYEFEVKGFQFAIVDSNGPAEVPRGFMTDEQLEWLERICSADDNRPLVIATHHNPQVGIPWLDDFMGIQNTGAFHNVIKQARGRLRGVFFGHVHQNIEIYREGVLYSSVLSSWCQFQAYPGLVETADDQHAEPGFNVVSLTDNQTFIRHYRFALPVS